VRRSFYLTGLIFLLPILAMATHIVGGEITYECQGYNASDDTYTYSITLTVYNDCGPANVNNTFFDDQASIGIFEGSDLYENLLVNYPGTYELIDTDLNNPCVTSPASACVRKAIYEGTVDLDFENGGYDIAYQRCCRNWSISNLNNAGSTGMTLHAYIPEPIDTLCNNSPVFNGLPPAFLCNNYDFELDFSASDADGDSLVYELCTPLWGGTVDMPQPSPPDSPPFFNVAWSTGYSADSPLSSIGGISLDPQTGILTGTPNEIGIFAIAICVTEYRDGVVLSQISRDYQIGVYNCPQVIESYFSEQNYDDLCSGMTIEFVNNSSNSSTYFWDFGVDSLASDTSSEEEPIFTFPEPGSYEVMLIAEPGGVCADTSYQEYTVQNPIVVFFEDPDVICDGASSYSFQAQGDFGDSATFEWVFGNGIPADFTENPQNIIFPGPGTYSINLNVNYNNCESDYTEDLVIPQEVIAAIVPQSEFCTGFDFTFENLSQNASSYQWIIGNFGDQWFSTENSPSYTFDEEGSYPVSLIAYNDLACPDTTTQLFEVYPYMMPYFELPQAIYCFDGHEIFLSAGGTYQEDLAEISWDFGLNANQMASDAEVPEPISFSEPGVYPITLYITENNCEKNYTQIVEIHPNPKAEFTVLDSSGCKPLSVQFINLSEAWTDMSYYWNLGNGAFSILESPATTYTYSGSFFPSLTVSTSSGCIDEDTYTLEWPIQVFPVPQANFTVEPNVVDILNPVVNITDFSLSSVDVYYELSNGDSIGSANAMYTFKDAGLWQITQTVWNSYGCSDKVTGGVRVNGFLFFLPNSFTPNGDGYNDIFKPEYTGIMGYEMQIYNRWGQLIFVSSDPAYGWDGNNAQDGVYSYFIKLTDLTKTPYHYRGSVTLVR
jgi:gliding motility-associated-like protein